jgi:hypothetical protein
MQKFKKVKSRQKQEKMRKNVQMSKYKRVAGRRGLFFVREGDMAVGSKYKLLGGLSGENSSEPRLC